MGASCEDRCQEGKEISEDRGGAAGDHGTSASRILSAALPSASCLSLGIARTSSALPSLTRHLRHSSSKLGSVLGLHESSPLHAMAGHHRGGGGQEPCVAPQALCAARGGSVSFYASNLSKDHLSV